VTDEKRYLHKSGKVMLGKVNACKVNNDQGNSYGYRTLIQEIDQEKRFEQSDWKNSLY